MSGVGWVIIAVSCVVGLVFWRLAHVEWVSRKRALIEQTLEYEAMRQEPRH